MSEPEQEPHFPQMTGTKQFALSGALLAVACLFAAVAAEVAVGALYPSSDRHYVLPPDAMWQRVPNPTYLPGVSDQASYTTSSLGIRGPELSQDEGEFRILAIGGSTTENLYLDDSESWPLLLSELLGPATDGRQTWSGDVGRSGLTSRSHVLQFDYLLRELPRIDLVVILVGVNDLTFALQSGPNRPPSPPLRGPQLERVELNRAFTLVPGSIREQRPLYRGEGIPAYKRLALYQLLSLTKERLTGRTSALSQDESGAVYSTWRTNRATAASMIEQSPDMTAALAEYRGHLESLIAMSQEYGVRLVFMTQPSLWREDLSDYEESLLWLGGLGQDFQGKPGGQYYSSAVLRQVMDAYNATLVELCRSTGTEYLDLAELLPRDTTSFYDDVHFTEHGSRLVAEHLAGYLRSQPPYLQAGS